LRTWIWVTVCVTLWMMCRLTLELVGGEPRICWRLRGCFRKFRFPPTFKLALLYKGLCNFPRKTPHPHGGFAGRKSQVCVVAGVLNLTCILNTTIGLVMNLSGIRVLVTEHLYRRQRRDTWLKQHGREWLAAHGGTAIIHKFAGSSFVYRQTGLPDLPHDPYWRLVQRSIHILLIGPSTNIWPIPLGLYGLVFVLHLLHTTS
jgi:hypothetical protein